MATLSVWKFDSPAGAEEALATLESLSKQNLIQVNDAATVTWEADAKKPKTRQANSLTGAGALGGTFWGMLFGLIFFIPLIGAAIGAATGALTGALTDIGIDDDFIATVREEVTPGTSALFVMTSDAVTDRVRDAFDGRVGELIYTNLPAAQEAALRATFSE